MAGYFTRGERTQVFEAGADLSGVAIGTIMTFNTDGRLVVCGNAGEDAVGVLHSRVGGNTVGAEATVALFNGSGVLSVLSGAAVTARNTIATDANGKAVDSAAGNHVVGVAMEAASAADQLILVSARSSYQRN